MFVSNKTGFECVLARGRLTDETSVLSVNVEVRYAISDDGSLHIAEPRARRDTDPPDIRRIPLWRGTSVTAAGMVLGPKRPPFVRTVSLRVNGTEHQVVVSGPRRWVRRGGTLAPSEPEPFEQVPLSWDLAFGGKYERAPGFAPDTGLPDPGGKVIYPLNPRGVGFYADDETAADHPLPAIELHDQPVQTPADRPQPGGLAPCADLPGLRMSELAPNRWVDEGSAGTKLERRVSSLLNAALLTQHVSPGPLIFDWLKTGTEIRLSGVGTGAMALATPSAPVLTWLRRGRDRDPLRGRLRALHLDGAARDAVAVFGFAQRFSTASPPHWIEVGGNSST
ncbi:MAG: DUF2169 domain-containing protein [Deltaproteobacteria bacterium]|jgi:hypothetical protein|nr:DUF2169 domain-containing protein [Deltaproteobacteria bacterium]MBW2532713.1 DUF2169 domain-containing protein [Deltaproteobacteria bacterium]